MGKNSDLTVESSHVQSRETVFNRPSHRFDDALLFSQGAGLHWSQGPLEDMALEAYRERRLTGAQLLRLLSITSRYELDGLLKERGVWLEYTLEDFRREGQITAPLLTSQNQIERDG